VAETRAISDPENEKMSAAGGTLSAFEQLARQMTRLSPEAIAHLQHLIATWGLVSDLSFADLLLFSPSAEDPKSYVVLALARPNTTHTLYETDPTGSLLGEAEIPYVARCWRSGEVVSTESYRADIGERIKVDSFPVRLRNAVVAVLVREYSTQVVRRPSPLEKTYLSVARTLLDMTAEGSFPFPSEELEVKEAPRVGDGTIKLDAQGAIEFASPNAVSALRKLGVTATLKGKTLMDLGLDQVPVRTAYTMKVPCSEEVEANNANVSFYVVPLLRSGDPIGALVLVRDLSEIRSRDKLLLSKDAAIREIHHRVKNNLQTIASLLRLQARRLTSPQAKQALEESVRRIGAIALVHEVLSREPGEQVSFKSILRSLVAMVEDALVPQDATIAIEIRGEVPDLPVAIATPMAVVVTELLQNAVQHGFVRREEGEAIKGEVVVSMADSDGSVVLEVRDNGIGFPQNFDFQRHAGLGLQIVDTLVRGELGGTIKVENRDGARVAIEVPVKQVMKA
jgi:two-component sensor histidine kinase